MNLPRELLSQFVKVTRDEPKKNDNMVVYGRYKIYNGAPHVILEGSDLLTPIATTVDAEEDELIAVQIKDHTAVATGNASSPAARTEDVESLDGEMAKVNTLLAHQVTADEITAINATFETLKAKLAEIEMLDVTEAQIDDLQAKIANLDIVNAEEVNVLLAQIENLEATLGSFEEIDTDSLNALNAVITTLKSQTADFTNATIKYADIDFANIGEAAIRKILCDTGLIQDLNADTLQVTGMLQGVVIKGDLIQGGTIAADKLLIKNDTNGLYYQLNLDTLGGELGDANLPEGVTEEMLSSGLLGNIIVAKSITADKVAISDLNAFKATIGGFIIGDTTLYSSGKGGVDSDNPGIYLDSDGQFSFGDNSNYIRFYKVLDDEGNVVLVNGLPQYKLDISADSILFGSDSRRSIDDIRDLTDYVKIGTYNDDDFDDPKPCIELSEDDSSKKHIITNTKSAYLDGEVVGTEIDSEGIITGNVTVNKELRQGNFVWATRANGNYGLRWKDVTG